MMARVALAAVLTIGALIFCTVLIADGGGRSLLDLSPAASSAYLNRLELEHAEEMARIEARRETADGVLLLLGILGVVAIVGGVVVATSRRTVVLLLPPHIEPDRIEAYWQEQDQRMAARGMLVDSERR